MMTYTTFIEIIGWIGSAFVVIAYILNISGKMKAQSIPYILLNMFGSGLLIINTYYLKAYPVAIINLIWVVVAIYSLIRAALKKTT